MKQTLFTCLDGFLKDGSGDRWLERVSRLSTVVAVLALLVGSWHFYERLAWDSNQKALELFKGYIAIMKEFEQDTDTGVEDPEQLFRRAKRGFRDQQVLLVTAEAILDLTDGDGVWRASVKGILEEWYGIEVNRIEDLRKACKDEKLQECWEEDKSRPSYCGAAKRLCPKTCRFGTPNLKKCGKCLKNPWNCESFDADFRDFATKVRNVSCWNKESEEDCWND